MGTDEPDPSADTVAKDEERSPSQQVLHDDVKAALFTGAARPEALDSGVVFAGRYRMVGLLGRGGMGEVYRAHDLELGEDVAIKFLPRAYARNPSLRARFVNEVRIARQITHPSVCRVHDIGEADGRHFLSMELIDGEDLSSLLRRIGRLPQEKALELAQQLCAGLAALHARGVLHRDLKPSNVMIDGEGRLKLADFGLAALADELRDDELRDGTPAYMAPEQAAGKEVTVKSDIFSLGLVLYELIAGRHAFASGTDATGKPKIDRGSTPSPMTTHVRGLPPELDDVIRACIDPDPSARPASALEVAAALPGGDPLAVALAAGRAPSVEAVAGVKLVGTLPAWMAYGLAAFIAIATLVYAAVEPMRSVLGGYHVELSTDVLTHRAREVLEATGAPPPRGDSIVNYRLEGKFVRAVGNNEIAMPEPSPTGPVPLLFDYRQTRTELSGWGESTSVWDPPMLEPGDARVTLDARGLLRALLILPPERVPEPAPCDFDPLLELAGLDPSALVEIEPVVSPTVYADERRAWTGTIETTGVDVTVEAAALGGTPVAFAVYPPWDPPPETSEADDDGVPKWGQYAIAIGFIGICVVVLVLARRSIRRGDADLHGAWRVALVVASLVATAVFFRGHHAGPFVELSLATWMLRNAMMFGGSTFLCYVIVEPYARRYLPGTMVGWTRLVRGRWRDPLVARDVLVGVAAALAFLLGEFGKFSLLGDSAPSLVPFQALYGGRHAFGLLADAAWQSVVGILQLFVVFLLLSMITRGKGRRAMVLFFLLWTFVEGNLAFTHDNPLVIVGVLVFAVLLAGMLVVVITRFGLLATAALQLGANLLLGFPVTLDFDAWYAPYGVIVFAALGALTLFGLRCARVKS